MSKVCQIPIKQQLKNYGVKIGECARFLNISRPTFDCYIKQYETQGSLTSDCYQVVFDHLFKESKKRTPEQFRQQLAEIHYDLVNEVLIHPVISTQSEEVASPEPDKRQLRLMKLRGKMENCMNESRPIPVKLVIKYNEILSEIH